VAVAATIAFTHWSDIGPNFSYSGQIFGLWWLLSAVRIFHLSIQAEGVRLFSTECFLF